MRGYQHTSSDTDGTVILFHAQRLAVPSIYLEPQSAPDSRLTLVTTRRLTNNPNGNPDSVIILSPAFVIYSIEKEVQEALNLGSPQRRGYLT